MISLPDLLRRFRRVWVPPGAALARVAPPVDVSSRLRSELRPVLEAIAEIQSRAAAIRSAAERQGTGLMTDAEAEAADSVRKAEADAPAARAAAADKRSQAVEGEVSAALKAAQAEATRIETDSQRRIPDLVEKVRVCVASGQGWMS